MKAAFMKVFMMPFEVRLMESVCCLGLLCRVGTTLARDKARVCVLRCDGEAMAKIDVLTFYSMSSEKASPARTC